MIIQAFTPIIARQSTVAKDLRQTRRADRTVVPSALPAFSAFSASIIERLLRREAGLWERFSLQYKEDEEANGAGPVQIHTQNNITLRFLLDHLKTEIQTQRKEAQPIPAGKTPASASKKQETESRFPAAGRPYSPAVLHQAFQTLRQTRQLSFAENTYYRQLLSMTAACAAAPMRTLPIAGMQNTGTGAALPTKEERMAAQIINGAVRTELTHFTAEEPPAPRDMSVTVQTLRREIAALEQKTAGEAASPKPIREKDAPISATIRALPHKAASSAIEQGLTARQHVRQNPQPVLRQIQDPAATVRFVPPAYVDPFGGKRPMGKLEWTDFGYREDGTAPTPVSRKASPAPTREGAAKKTGLQPPRSTRQTAQATDNAADIAGVHPTYSTSPTAQQWENDTLIPLSPDMPQTAAQMAVHIPSAEQTPLTMAQMAAPVPSAEQTPLTMAQIPPAEGSVSQQSRPVSSGSEGNDAASRGTVQPEGMPFPAEEPTYLTPQEAQPVTGSIALRGAIQPNSMPASEEPTYLSPQAAQPPQAISPLTGSVLPVEDERAADAAHFFESYAQLYPEAAQESAASPAMRGTVLPGRTAAYAAPETAYLENAAQNDLRRNRVHSLNNEYNVQKNVPPGLDAKAIGKITDEVFMRIDKRIRNERRRYGL